MKASQLVEMRRGMKRRIEAILRHRGWSASELSIRAGLARSNVGHMLVLKSAKWETVCAIASAAKVNAQWLLTGEGEMNPQPMDPDPVAPTSMVQSDINPKRRAPSDPVSMPTKVTKYR